MTRLALRAVEPETVAPPELLRRGATRFLRVLRDLPDSAALPSPTLPPVMAGSPALQWRNWLFRGADFARAHIELFELPGVFAVLHVCVVPRPDSPAPIYGFDIVGGRAQTTGMFLDFTPVQARRDMFSLREVLPTCAADLAGTARQRPPWGDFFSDDFLALRPDSRANTVAALALGIQALGAYVARLPEVSDDRDPSARDGQVAYALGQRRNPHTFRMLARYVGEAEARGVMETLLFPLPF